MKPAAAGSSRKVPVKPHPKGPLASGGSKVTAASKAKAGVRGLKTTTKPLVSKSKTKAAALAGKVKGKVGAAGGVKKAVLKKKGPVKAKMAAQTGESNLQAKAAMSETVETDSGMLVEEEDGVPRSIETTLTESAPATGEVPEALGVSGGNGQEGGVALESMDIDNQAQAGKSKLNPEPVDTKSLMLVAEEGGETPAVAEKEEDEPGCCQDAENQPQTGQNEDKPVPGASAMLREVVVGGKSAGLHPSSQPEAAERTEAGDVEPMQLGETEPTGLRGVSGGASAKEEKPPADVSEGVACGEPAAPPLEEPAAPSENPVTASEGRKPKLPGPAQATSGPPQDKTVSLHPQQRDGGPKVKEEGTSETYWCHFTRGQAGS